MAERVWEPAQRGLGCSGEGMAVSRGNPRHAGVLSRGGARTDKHIVTDVVEAHGRNSHSRVGDRLYLAGAGILLTERCPRKAWVHISSAAAAPVSVANELSSAGVHRHVQRFNGAGCLDVGPQRGGWGKVVVETGEE